MSEPIRQYVNVPRGNAHLRQEIPKERAGRRVKLSVTVNREAGKTLAGVPVLFELMPGGANIRLHADKRRLARLPKGKLRKDKGGTRTVTVPPSSNPMARPGVGCPSKARIKTRTNAKGIAKADLWLSEFGGDKFHVNAYLLDRTGNKVGEPLKTETYEVWKRFYYQVDFFKGQRKGEGRSGHLKQVRFLSTSLTDPLSDGVTDEYEARYHNIELKSVGPPRPIERQANVLYRDEDEQHSAWSRYDSIRKFEPLLFHVLVVNQLAEPAPLVFDARNLLEGEHRTITIRGTHERTVDTVTKKTDVACLWHDESMPLKKDWFIRARWQFVPVILQDGITNQAWQKLPDDRVDSPNATTVELRFLDRVPSETIQRWVHSDFWGAPVGTVMANAAVTCRCVVSKTAGFSWHNAVWIADQAIYRGGKYDHEYSAEFRANTVVHELGHGLGMVPPSQSSCYTGKGHHGPHCSEGLTSSELASADYGDFDGTCVMFGTSAEVDPSSGTKPPIMFCGKCDPSLRTCILELDRLPTGWRPQQKKGSGASK